MAKHVNNRRSKRSANSDPNKDNRQARSALPKKQQKDVKTSRKPNNVKDASRHQVFQSLAVLTLSIGFAFLNSFHQSSMFENDRHFSHLSSLEREMTFRTEMGMYYSFFKTIIEAPSLYIGINQIMHDNLTEYPSVINTLERFNLYPEVLLGAGYRAFQGIATYLNIKTKECWKVLRGEELPPIQSCEGLGEPAYFYTTSVFLLNGLLGALIFLYGTFLSNSIFGGLVAAVCFFFNHGECTRVQWTPPLRESFGYPIFLLQMLVVTLIIRSQRPKCEEWVITGLLTMTFVLFWQFAQFALLTQTLSVYLLYIFYFIPAEILQTILKGHMFGLSLALCFLFANKMLLSSFYTSSLAIIYVASTLENRFKKLNSKPMIMLVQLLFLAAGTATMKLILTLTLNIQDDVHIWNILRSKLTSYKDFHTMLYTCAAEFDFMKPESFIAISKTLLLPTSIIVLTVVVVKMYFARREAVEIMDHESSSVAYNILQLMAFSVMAVFVMRLKLFFVPHLCIITSLICCRKYFSFVSKQEFHYGAVALVLGLMAIQGVQNIQHQRSIMGEFSNPPLEELITWINNTTPNDAVFGGPMPTMANLLLSTRRPVVNHPHYENAGLRNRTYQVYKIYSRKTALEVYNILKSMKLNFVVIERHWCYGKSREGCGMVDLWDVEDQDNRNREPLCQTLLVNPTPFKIVFRNTVYTVLKL